MMSRTFDYNKAQKVERSEFHAQPRPCKGCDQLVYYRYTPAGQVMPLDRAITFTATPGCYVIDSTNTCRPAEPMFDAPGTEYHLTHFATCPKADQFRKGGHRV